jgi:serine/threonine protein kinase
MAVLHGNDRDEPNDTDVAAGATRTPAADSGKPYPSVTYVSNRYRLIKPLGGTPGDILYLAQHLQTGALVEVRLFTGDRRADDDLVDALRHLAARAARASDQCAGIATLSECERTGGVGLALAMGHHDGTTLREAIRRKGGLDPDRAISIAVKIAEILQRAHTCGLVHGGLRPDNVVLIGPEPTVLLTQYGVDRILARWTASRRRKGAVLRNHSIYQAPEQVHGETTERGDIYAFGAILYEMLAGSFPRTGIASIRRGHLESLAKRRPGITPSLARIVSRTLHLKPERRPDIAALCNDLRAEIGTNEQPNQLRRRPVVSLGRWARAWRTSLVGGGLIIALGLAFWVTQEYLVPQDTRWALPWSLFAPANSGVLDNASRALTAPTPAAPIASPSPPASPSAVASPPVESSSPPRADAVTTAPTSPEQSSEPRGEEKAPPSPSSPPEATTRPRPPAPRVDARSEPANARPRDVLPAPRPSAPNPPEPARTPWETSEDPGAVIDWLLKEGHQRRAP